MPQPPLPTQTLLRLPRGALRRWAGNQAWGCVWLLARPTLYVAPSSATFLASSSSGRHWPLRSLGHAHRCATLEPLCFSNLVISGCVSICHWESPPQSIFLTLDSENFVASMQLWLDQFPCCLDADCGRRMQRLPPGSIESPDFRDMIDS